MSFEARIKEALEEVQKVLDLNKCPILPEDQEHTYADKFTLVEQMVKCTIPAFKNILAKLADEQKSHLHLEKREIVTLCCKIDKTCEFDQTVETKISNGGYTSEKSGLMKAISKSELFTVVTEHLYNYMTNIKFTIIDKQGKEDILYDAKPVIVLKTSAKVNPYPTTPQIVHSVSTPLLTNSYEFKINRSDPECHTPRRNNQVKDVLDSLSRLYNFFNNLSNDLIQIFQKSPEFDSTSMQTLFQKRIFLPVLPVLDSVTIDFPNELIFKKAHAEQFDLLIEQLGASIQEVQMFKLGLIICSCSASIMLIQGYYDGVEYIEHLLTKQLVSAIGNTLKPKDLDEFMKFHNHKIFKPEFRPLPLSIDVRRKGYTPEGAVSIEKSKSGEKEIIYTFSKSFCDGPDIKVGLNASTIINLKGKVSVHGYIQQTFSTEEQNQHELICRARQFSNFIILIGTMIDDDIFDVKSGLIIQNKDLIIIPLLFATIPTAKEFKKQIESLSDEQQKFLKMFRSMQLQSTLFTFCIIQIKPQLEKVLGLPDGSLTKEIKLTQDLMELFIEYQISPDLLKYKGTEEAALPVKLAVVRDSTKAILDMIIDSKKEEYNERMKEAELLKLEQQKLDSNNSHSYGDYEDEKVVKKKKAPNPRMSRMLQMSPGNARRMDEGMCPPCPPPPHSPPKSCPTPPPSAPSGSGSSQQAPPKYETTKLPNYTETHRYTLVPTQMEKYFVKFLPNSQSRPTIISTILPYQKTDRKTITSQPQTKILDQTQEKLELAKTLDLLDALTVSGELILHDCEVHVVVCLTECFDETIMDTLIKKNQDPIEALERAGVVVCLGINGKSEVLLDEEKVRVKQSGFVFD
jgi:hypothetical protein